MGGERGSGEEGDHGGGFITFFSKYLKIGVAMQSVIAGYIANHWKLQKSTSFFVVI